MPVDAHDPYGDPSIYDILTSPGTESEVTGLLAMATATRPTRGRWRWLEPACGTGRYLRHAARHGIDVWGFDASEGMVRYAASHLPARFRAQLWVADFTAFAAGIAADSIDFAFNLGNSLRHVAGDEAVLAHLDEMALVLRKTGLYAVGLDLCDTNRELTEDVWTAERDRCRVTQVLQCVPGRNRQETLLSHLVIERDGAIEHRDHVYVLRTYRRNEWEDLLARAGWTIVDEVDEHGRSTRHAPFAYGIHLLRPVNPRRR